MFVGSPGRVQIIAVCAIDTGLCVIIAASQTTASATPAVPQNEREWRPKLNPSEYIEAATIFFWSGCVPE